MALKRINTNQVEAGKAGMLDLGIRLNAIDTEVGGITADVDKVNEAIMLASQAPSAYPVFFDVATKFISGSDMPNQGSPFVINIPDSKTYLPGKNQLQVFRNGVQQVLNEFTGIWSEKANGEQVEFEPGSLDQGDVISFIIGKSSKLAYAMAVAYYTEGADDGRIQTITYTGDIAKVVTYTYNASGKVATEVVVEDGVTLTRTFTYGGNGAITGVGVVIS